MKSNPVDSIIIDHSCTDVHDAKRHNIDPMIVRNPVEAKITVTIELL